MFIKIYGSLTIFANSSNGTRSIGRIQEKLTTLGRASYHCYPSRTRSSALGSG